MTKALIIIFIMVASIANAQNSFQGGAFQGGEVGDPLPKQLGVFGWWDAGYGINTTAVGKVQTWADLSGNNFVMCNYSNAALTSFNTQPLFTRTPSTNTFPAVNITLPIGTSSPRPLRLRGAFPAAYAGVNKPFTFITLCAPITNASSGVTWAFQAVNGTQSLTSVNMTFIPLTSGQTRINVMGDTNRASGITFINFNAGITISNYYYATFTYDGVNARAYANLAATANLTPVSQGIISPDHFQISGCIRTNYSGTDLNGQTYLTAFLAWTNALTGPQVTNVINWYNNNRYKAF
jgi:hypothetical protein